ncbi:MAG: hypothetical protein B6247_25165 [Candidatus Parabeggiatoa sp. nov. 2]|nr:MAG: hypothetical protein B6247_25165 [Beggiatoa sp. 4572_84]
MLEGLVTGKMGKMEFKIKINELPTDIKILENKWVAFVIDAQPEQVKVTIQPKTWKKWQKAATDYPAWVAEWSIGARI